MHVKTLTGRLALLVVLVTMSVGGSAVETVKVVAQMDGFECPTRGVPLLPLSPMIP
jgi:hypothetical protein